MMMREKGVTTLQHVLNASNIIKRNNLSFIRTKHLPDTMLNEQFRIHYSEFPSAQLL
jgi:hypothetical protein